MNNKTDRRILRTKETIRKAFIELLGSKGFDALTVSDIAENANINRGTFYLHYDDKFDLLGKIENEILDDLKSIMAKSSSLDISEYRKKNIPFPIYEQVFEFLRKNAPLMNCLLGIQGNAGFPSRIKNTISENIFKIGFFANKKESDLFVPREYLLAYLVSANMGVIQTWLQKGCIESNAEMSRIMFSLSAKGPLFDL